MHTPYLQEQGSAARREEGMEMTDKQTPPDWVLIEAGKRFKWTFGADAIDDLRDAYNDTADNEEHGYRALCDMIEKYEQPPVDRKLLCAREAYARWTESDTDLIGVRAIELWESGYGS
jgi:hypothetical protein